MSRYGLIGKNIEYSFSKIFFTNKFESEKTAHSYHNFDIENIVQFKRICNKNTDLKGLNITIPYKQEVIQYLDTIDKEAQAIGAVNTVKFLNDGTLVGYNTDHYGFRKALASFPALKSKTALILGTGGASKAIKYVLDSMGFKYIVVSRSKTKETITYNQLTKDIIESHTLIVNTTPLGVAPNISECPNIPYEFINQEHFLFDLIYNPTQTAFLKHGLNKGATISNGIKMLEYQAEKSWSIWNN
ncbi:MAG: shikimate dehydrogenase [Candidatus Paceibacteria bacterium]|jgi:shikimate dehydrogenase